MSNFWADFLIGGELCFRLFCEKVIFLEIFSKNSPLIGEVFREASGGCSKNSQKNTAFKQ